MDFCGGTCSTAKAFVFSDQHRTFVGCVVDCDVLTAAEADHLLTFASQVSDTISEINGSAEVKATAKVFKNEKAALWANKRASSWNFHPVCALRKYCQAIFSTSSQL